MTLCSTRLFMLLFHESKPFYISSLVYHSQNLSSTDTHGLIKLKNHETFDCLCVLVCMWPTVWLSSCVHQDFMGWCHGYAALPLRDLQNSHLRFYAVWQSPGRGHEGHGEITSFMAQANLRWCRAMPGIVLRTKSFKNFGKWKMHAVWWRDKY